MKHFTLTLSLILTLLFITACAPTNNGGKVYFSSTNYEREKIAETLKQCKLDSLAKVPSQTVVGSTPSMDLPVTCTTNAGMASCSGGSVGGQIYSYDKNEGLREDIRFNCLKKAKIFDTEIFTPLEKCPKWTFAGAYDGQFTAEELVTMFTGHFKELFVNPNPYLERTGAPNHCVVRSSNSDTDEGVTAVLHNFPNYFEGLSAKQRRSFVLVRKAEYPYSQPLIKGLIYSKTFDEAVEYYQLHINLCTDVISAEDFWIELSKIISRFQGRSFSLDTVKTFEDSYYKKLKNSKCNKDEMP